MPAKVQAPAIDIRRPAPPKSGTVAAPLDSTRPAIPPKQPRKPVFHEALKQASDKFKPKSDAADDSNDTERAEASSPQRRKTDKADRSAKTRKPTSARSKPAPADDGPADEVPTEEAAPDDQPSAESATDADSHASHDEADPRAEKDPGTRSDTPPDPTAAQLAAAQQLTTAAKDGAATSPDDTDSGQPAVAPAVAKSITNPTAANAQSEPTNPTALANATEPADAASEPPHADESPSPTATARPKPSPTAKRAVTAPDPQPAPHRGDQKSPDGAPESSQLQAIPPELTQIDAIAAASGDNSDAKPDITPALGDLSAAESAVASTNNPNQPATATARAAQPQLTPAPDHPDARFAETNHPRLVSSIRGELLPKGGTMHIRLDPPELGALQVTVRVVDGAVTASFQTTNDDATRLLSHSLNQLKHVLESSGVSVDKLQVQQASKDMTPNQDQDPNQQSRDGQSSQQEQWREHQRREMLRRVWSKLSDADPLDVTG